MVGKQLFKVTSACSLGDLVFLLQLFSSTAAQVQKRQIIGLIQAWGLQGIEEKQMR